MKLSKKFNYANDAAQSGVIEVLKIKKTPLYVVKNFSKTAQEPAKYFFPAEWSPLLEQMMIKHKMEAFSPEWLSKKVNPKLYIESGQSIDDVMSEYPICKTRIMGMVRERISQILLLSPRKIADSECLVRFPENTSQQAKKITGAFFEYGYSMASTKTELGLDIYSCNIKINTRSTTKRISLFLLDINE